MYQGQSQIRFSVAALAFSLSVITPSVMASDLIVSAASSLTNAFKELGQGFQSQHADLNVLNSFAASDVLAQQIINGAPVDVFASADQVAMDKAEQAGVIDRATRVDFAQNVLVLIVPVDNPKQIQKIADLAQPEVTRVAYGNPASVPVGRYTQQALQREKQWEMLQAKHILGQNVRQVLDYVVRGEVDAGFVFKTDALAFQDQVQVVQEVDTPEPVRYPLALVQQTPTNPQAQAYLDYILSAEAQEILAKHGFKAP